MDVKLKRSVPEPLAPIKFDIPKPFQVTLDNGLRVVVFENERLPLVSFRLAFYSGDINDPKDSTGMTLALASMITEGTEAYSSRQLAEKIERLGASVSASASDDFTIIAASCLSLYSSEILHLLAEVIQRPTFPDNELDLYRRNTVEHLKFQRSQPGFLAGEQAARLIYGETPYSKVSPKAANVEEPPIRNQRTLTIVNRPGSAQSNIVLTNLGIKRMDPDYFPLLVMNQVLGAGASSRIFMNLREEKGYTYGAYTRLETKKLAGDFEATAEVRTAVTGDSLKEFFYELDRMRNEKVGETELADAKNFLTGVFPLRAETQEGLTNLIVNQHLFGLPDDYLQTYRDHDDAVTVDEEVL